MQNKKLKDMSKEALKQANEGDVKARREFEKKAKEFFCTKKRRSPKISAKMSLDEIRNHQKYMIMQMIKAHESSLARFDDVIQSIATKSENHGFQELKKTSNFFDGFVIDPKYIGKPKDVKGYLKGLGMDVMMPIPKPGKKRNFV